MDAMRGDIDRAVEAAVEHSLNRNHAGSFKDPKRGPVSEAGENGDLKAIIHETLSDTKTEGFKASPNGRKMYFYNERTNTTIILDLDVPETSSVYRPKTSAQGIRAFQAYPEDQAKGFILTKPPSIVPRGLQGVADSPNPSVDEARLRNLTENAEEKRIGQDKFQGKDYYKTGDSVIIRQPNGVFTLRDFARVEEEFNQAKSVRAANRVSADYSVSGDQPKAADDPRATVRQSHVQEPAAAGPDKPSPGERSAYYTRGAAESFVRERVNNVVADAYAWTDIANGVKPDTGFRDRTVTNLTNMIGVMPRWAQIMTMESDNFGVTVLGSAEAVGKELGRYGMEAAPGEGYALTHVGQVIVNVNSTENTFRVMTHEIMHNLDGMLGRQFGRTHLSDNQVWLDSVRQDYEASRNGHVPLYPQEGRSVWDRILGETNPSVRAKEAMAEIGSHEMTMRAGGMSDAEIDARMKATYPNMWKAYQEKFVPAANEMARSMIARRLAITQGYVKSELALSIANGEEWTAEKEERARKTATDMPTNQIESRRIYNREQEALIERNKKAVVPAEPAERVSPPRPPGQESQSQLKPVLPDAIGAGQRLAVPYDPRSSSGLGEVSRGMDGRLEYHPGDHQAARGIIRQAIALSDRYGERVGVRGPEFSFGVGPGSQPDDFRYAFKDIDDSMAIKRRQTAEEEARAKLEAEKPLSALRGDERINRQLGNAAVPLENFALKLSMMEHTRLGIERVQNGDLSPFPYDPDNRAYGIEAFKPQAAGFLEAALRRAPDLDAESFLAQAQSRLTETSLVENIVGIRQRNAASNGQNFDVEQERRRLQIETGGNPQAVLDIFLKEGFPTLAVIDLGTGTVIQNDPSRSTYYSVDRQGIRQVEARPAPTVIDAPESRSSLGQAYDRVRGTVFGASESRAAGPGAPGSDSIPDRVASDGAASDRAYAGGALHHQMGRGAGVAMGAYGLYEQYKTGGSAEADLGNRQTRKLAQLNAAVNAGAVAADATEAAAAGGAAVNARIVQRAAEAGADLERLAKAGRAVSGLSRAARIAPPVSIALTVAAGAVDGTIGYKTGDGNRTARAAGATGGALLGAAGGGLAGAKAGAVVGGAIGAFFGGIGAVPGAAIGGFIGGLGGAIYGGIKGAELGGQAGEKLGGKALQAKFDERLNPALSELNKNQSWVRHLDRDRSGSVDLKELRRGLNGHEIKNLSELDRNRDGRITGAEVSQRLNQAIGDERREIAADRRGLDKMNIDQLRKAIREDGVLPDSVTRGGRQVEITKALEDPAYLQTAKDQFTKMHLRGDGDYSRQVALLSELQERQSGQTRPTAAPAPGLQMAR